MEEARILLGPAEGSRLVRFVRIIFGVICIGLAGFWVIYGIRASDTAWSVWITVAFLTGFGLYQVWAGSGSAVRYIVIGSEAILLRKNSLLPEKKIEAGQLSRIDFFPLNIVFHWNDGGKTILRFGTSYTDIIEPVIEGIEDFAERNNIPAEIRTEEL